MTETSSLKSLIEKASQAYLKGDFLVAAHLFEQAVQEYTTQSDPLAAAEMANNQSVALLKGGDASNALRVAEGTDQVFAQANDLTRQAGALGNQAAALEALSHLKEALEHYQHCNQLLKQIGDIERRVFVLKSISALQLRMGKRLEAMASMAAALDIQKNLSFKEKILKILLQLPFKFLGSG